jgi:hypothetical protein
MSNAGGMSTITRYTDMLAGNAVWNPWEPQGAFDALATVTVPSGGLASITFAGIPQNYEHLQIRISARTNRSIAADNVSMTFNGDGVGGSSYDFHGLVGNGSAASAFAVSPSGIVSAAVVPGSTTTASVFGTSIVDILDYSMPNKNRVVRTLTGYDANGSGTIRLISGLYRSTAPISTITLWAEATFLHTEFSQFTLYGVR